MAFTLELGTLGGVTILPSMHKSLTFLGAQCDPAGGQSPMSLSGYLVFLQMWPYLETESLWRGVIEEAVLG